MKNQKIMDLGSSDEEIRGDFFNCKTSTSMKHRSLFSTPAKSPITKDKKIRNVLMTNLHDSLAVSVGLNEEPSNLSLHSYEQSLRHRYKDMKSKYLSSEYSKKQLQRELRKSYQQKCNMCDIHTNEYKSTKKALQEALSLSQILLRQINQFSR